MHRLRVPTTTTTTTTNDDHDSRADDNEIYAQPLYVSSVRIPGLGVRDVLYVATVNNTVFAFDADDPNANEPPWTVNLTGTGARPVERICVDLASGGSQMRAAKICLKTE